MMINQFDDDDDEHDDDDDNKMIMRLPMLSSGEGVHDDDADDGATTS